MSIYPKNYLIFEAESTENQIFFDPHLEILITVRLKGILGVNVKTFKKCFSFKLNNITNIIDLKINHNLSLLSLQQNRHVIELYNFIDGVPAKCANEIAFKTSKITSFMWISLKNILVISEDSFSIHSINGTTLQINSEVIHTSPILFFYYCTQYKILLLFFKESCENYKYVEKTESFVLASSEPITIEGQHVSIILLYNRLYICAPKENAEKQFKEYPKIIRLYRIKKKNTECSNILLLPDGDDFKFTVIDNLIILHNINERKSYLYDVLLHVHDDGQIKYHRPVFESITFDKMKIESKFIPNLSESLSNVIEFDPYDNQSDFLLTNFLLDKKFGILWTLDVCLATDANSNLSSLIERISFYSRRRSDFGLLQTLLSELSEEILSKLREDFLENEEQCTLKMQKLMDSQIRICSQYPFISTKLTQDYLVEEIFKKIDSMSQVSERSIKQFLLSNLLKWSASLTKSSISISNNLKTLIIDLMTLLGMEKSLIFFLQSNLFESLKENLFSPFELICSQTSLDLKQRFKTSERSIADEILKKHDLMSLMVYCGRRPQILVDDNYHLTKTVLERMNHLTDPVLKHSIKEFLVFNLSQIDESVATINAIERIELEK